VRVGCCLFMCFVLQGKEKGGMQSVFFN